MEERRFDDLTRELGKASNRRQVVKGLVAGLLGGMLSVRGRGAPPFNPPSVSAADATCSATQYESCLHDAKTVYKSLKGNCGTVDGPGWGRSLCKLAASAEYARLISQCQAAQCPAGMSCVDGHCCSGPNCCTSDQVFCGGNGPADGTCCPAGSVCCEHGCCTPDKTCCLNYHLGITKQSTTEVCTDLQTDANNCGTCRHKCDSGLPCVDGVCQPCPSGQSLCKGPIDQVCCQANEHCQISSGGFAECVPTCDACETYDPSSQQCVPSDDGTACGSGLVCCGGSCISSSCPGAQQLNYDTCQCECPDVTCPGGGSPDPTTCQCGCSPTPPDTCQPPNIWHPETCFCEIDCGPYGCGG